MKVLYVVGSNLSRNTSANISHNAYVQGLLENGYQVDIVMASSSWGQDDASLPAWKEATYFTYNSVTFIERLKIKIKQVFDKEDLRKADISIKAVSSTESSASHVNWKSRIRNIMKKSYYLLFKTSALYSLEGAWLKNASRFKSSTSYDLIISNGCSTF